MDKIENKKQKTIKTKKHIKRNMNWGTIFRLRAIALFLALLLIPLSFILYYSNNVSGIVLFVLALIMVLLFIISLFGKILLRGIKW